jgi:hypothetical protein
MTDDNVEGEPTPSYHEVVATCPYCSEPVHRDDPRALDADELLGHLACVDAVEGDCTACGRPVSLRHKREHRGDRVAHKGCLEARARRRPRGPSPLRSRRVRVAG